jgi:hypothetical protein
MEAATVNGTRDRSSRVRVSDMRDFKQGDRIRALDPETFSEVEGSFRGLADPRDTIEVLLESGSAETPGAWIELDDGTSLRVAYHQLRPAYWQSVS